MAQHNTFKGTARAKQQTIARRKVRAVKAGATRVNATGRKATVAVTVYNTIGN